MRDSSNYCLIVGRAVCILDFIRSVVVFMCSCLKEYFHCSGRAFDSFEICDHYYYIFLAFKFYTFRLRIVNVSKYYSLMLGIWPNVIENWWRSKTRTWNVSFNGINLLIDDRLIMQQFNYLNKMQKIIICAQLTRNGEDSWTIDGYTDPANIQTKPFSLLNNND